MTGRGMRSFARLVVGLTLIGGVLAQAGAAQAAATITVDTFDDQYAEDLDHCSLREAISSAGADGDNHGCTASGTYGDDTILLPPGTYTLTRNGAEDQGEMDLDITGTGDVTIQSMGGTAQNTIIQAGSIGTEGTPNGIDRVFEITSPEDVTLRDLTIRNGNETTLAGGGGIYHHGSDDLRLERVAVRNNSASEEGAGIKADTATVRMTQVEISGNESGASGGGLYAPNANIFGGSVTVSSNRADGGGGGMFVDGGFSAFSGTTVAGNTANADNAGTSDDGGGVAFNQNVGQSLYFAGSIIADNAVGTGSTGPDCSGNLNDPPAEAAKANVVENPAGCNGIAAGDIGLDPQLQGLALNAPGSTQTHAIPASSPAVDRYPSGDCLNATSKFDELPFDQRGVSRPQGAACDSGAFELQASDNVPGICKGKTATITGTPENDSLRGTGGNDVIAALGGNDTVNGAGKNDLVCGGDGNDRLKGGGGKDKLLGENGNDNLKGGGGDKDKTIGGKGKDKCSGGGGEKDRAKKCETVKAVP